MGISALILFGCGADKVTYEEGFPEKDSEGLRNFMAYYLFDNMNYLYMQEENYIYADRNGNKDIDNISYFEFTEKQLREYYDPLFESDEPSTTMKELFDYENRIEHLHHPIDDVEAYNLPEINREYDNVLKMNVSNAEREISLSELDDRIDVKDEIRMNLVAANEQGFTLYVENNTVDGDFYLFASKDLKEVDLYEVNELDKVVESGDLERYYSLLEPIGESGIYAKLNNGSIVNMEEHTVHQIQQGDKRSADWNYVYLDGTKKEFTDGTQKIQTIENYLEGNDAYEAEFSFTFKKIAKEMGIKTSGPSISEIHYFSGNFIVLSLNYKGVVVGTAGHTNVMIDLQANKDNPTAYVVDLGL